MTDAPFGHFNVLNSILTLLAFSGLAGTVQAGLIGTEVTLSSEVQVTSSSPLIVASFPRRVTVDATTVEYPDVASLFDPSTPVLPGFAHSLVNVAIDVGDNFITIDFDNAGSGFFASAFKNGSLFEFDSSALATITGATVDTRVTTLGLTNADLIFSGNTLFVNVEGLPFHFNSFVRIDLTVEGGPSEVPEPSALVLLLTGGAVIGAVARARRRANPRTIQ